MLRHRRDVWSRAPRTLKVYFGGFLALALVCLALHPSLSTILSAVFGLTLAYLMLRGVRWVWIFQLATTTLLLALRLLHGAGWINVGINAVALGLLLAPETRRYFHRDRPLIPTGARLRENWAVRAAAGTVGLYAITMICKAIGGAAIYVGLVAILGMLLSGIAALLLSVIGLVGLIRESGVRSE